MLLVWARQAWIGTLSLVPSFVPFLMFSLMPALTRGTNLAADMPNPSYTW